VTSTPALITAVPIVSAFVNSKPVFTVTSTPVSVVISALNIQRRKKLKEIRNMTSLQGQHSEVKNPATLLALRIKMQYFFRMKGSFKLTIQGEHIEGHYIRLRSFTNRVLLNHG
jgi:hypothetical protein